MTDSSQECDMTHSREMFWDSQAMVNRHLSFVVTNFVRRLLGVKLTRSWELSRSTTKRKAPELYGDSQRSDYYNGIYGI